MATLFLMNLSASTNNGSFLSNVIDQKSQERLQEAAGNKLLGFLGLSNHSPEKSSMPSTQVIQGEKQPDETSERVLYDTEFAARLIMKPGETHGSLGVVTKVGPHPFMKDAGGICVSFDAVVDRAGRKILPVNLRDGMVVYGYLIFDPKEQYPRQLELRPDTQKTLAGLQNKNVCRFGVSAAFTAIGGNDVHAVRFE